jgi:hypothetical protein
MDREVHERLRNLLGIWVLAVRIAGCTTNRVRALQEVIEEWWDVR